jgi:hypothetical protein
MALNIPARPPLSSAGTTAVNYHSKGAICDIHVHRRPVRLAPVRMAGEGHGARKRACYIFCDRRFFPKKNPAAFIARGILGLP